MIRKIQIMMREAIIAKASCPTANIYVLLSGEEMLDIAEGTPIAVPKFVQTGAQYNNCLDTLGAKDGYPLSTSSQVAIGKVVAVEFEFVPKQIRNDGEDSDGCISYINQPKGLIESGKNISRAVLPNAASQYPLEIERAPKF